MAMIAIGGLAKGLAEGMQMGAQMRNQQELIDLRKKDQERLTKQDERDAEIHELRKDQYASEKEIRDRRNNALRQIAEYTQSAMGGAQPATRQAAPAQTGGMPLMQTPSDQGGLGGASFNNQMGALAPSMPAAQQAETANPGKILERGMVTGMYSPKHLTDIANIFAANGLHEEGIKYMNQAYEAEKRGVVRASMALLQNNPDAAMQSLQSGGVQLEGVPTKVSTDPQDSRWKINIAGQGEQTIDVRDWLQSTMDPEKFFELEDRRRKQERESDLDERKLDLAERKTNAEVGFLKSRSQLAQANADKADRWEPGVGGLRASRSSEAQINTALSRRDKAFDRISMVKDEFGGKSEVDPMRRQVLDSASNQYQSFIEDQLGEELDARQHHKFTDAMLSYPVGGTPEQIEDWQRKELLPRMGFRSKAKAAEGQPVQTERTTTPTAAALSRASSEAPPQTGPKPGSLAWMKQKADERAAITREMEGVQKALQTPNLTTEQKKALAIKAQEIATRRDSLR